MEEAVEAHVPDVLNPFARYRQTGHSSFVDPTSGDETVENPSPETLAMAREHLVSRSYAHEPLQKLAGLLAGYGEYASALYASGAVSTLLGADGISTLSLSRAYVVETILQLAMGDPVAAEQTFLSRHCNSRPYLSSREAQLAEELTQAIKRRDLDALDEARSPSGRNRSALANLDESLRALVGQLRISVREQPLAAFFVSDSFFPRLNL
jgi:ATP/maltotriose-dependent transcriptional regulator MalT